MLVLINCCAVLMQNVVEPKAAIVREEEARAQEKADAAKAIKDECEADLAEVGCLVDKHMAWAPPAFVTMFGPGTG